MISRPGRRQWSTGRRQNPDSGLTLLTDPYSCNSLCPFSLLVDALHLNERIAIMINSDFAVGADLDGQAIVRRANRSLCPTALCFSEPSGPLRLETAP